MPAESAIAFLQSWVQGQSNGAWEHAHGITIETLSTPGWLVTVDLQETALEGRSMRELSVRRSDRDWVLCKVEHNQFRGEGDPGKLAAILRVFETFASETTTVK